MLFFKALSHWLRVGFSLAMCLLLSVKVMVVRERGGCDWEAELTLITPGAGVATQSCQGRSEAVTCWASSSTSAFQVSGVDSLYC